MLIPIAANAWVPLHRIERITFLADAAMVKYSDAREPESVQGNDAHRLRVFVENHQRAAPDPQKRGPGRPKGVRK
jgi:hypothetical protein